MKVAFSRNEVIEMAVQIEKRGLAFFNAMQESASHGEVKKVFAFLASEEQEHI